MERNKIKIIFGLSIFCVFFISAVLLFIANFVSRMLIVLAMSNMNYSTSVPVIAEPVLVVFSGVCFIMSAVALAISLSLVKKHG